jgi:hypothetical protein
MKWTAKAGLSFFLLAGFAALPVQCLPLATT